MDCKCDNCSFTCSHERLRPARDLNERLDFPLGHPNCVVPAGECPRCGALSYAVGVQPALDEWLSAHFASNAATLMTEALLALREAKIRALVTLRSSEIKPGGRKFQLHDFGISDIDELLKSLDVTPTRISDSIKAARAAIRRESEPRYYAVQIWRDVEPEISGPYGSINERDAALCRLHREAPDDGIFGLTIDDRGLPSMSVLTEQIAADDVEDSASDVT